MPRRGAGVTPPPLLRPCSANGHTRRWDPETTPVISSVHTWWVMELS